MKLKNRLIIGIAAAALAVGTLSTRAQERQRLTDFAVPTAIATNLQADTVNAPGTWTNVPQNVDYWILLTPTAPGALAGTSNTTVYVDASPNNDGTVVLSNWCSFTTSNLLTATNVTAFWVSKTNTGLKYWRIGKATTTCLTNVSFKLQWAAFY